MLNVNKRNYVMGHVMTLWIFNALKRCSVEELWRGAQSTQLKNWAEKRSREKSREVQGFLFDQDQKEKKGKGFNQTLWKSNIDVDWW